MNLEGHNSILPWPRSLLPHSPCAGPAGALFFLTLALRGSRGLFCKPLLPTNLLSLYLHAIESCGGSQVELGLHQAWRPGRRARRREAENMRRERGRESATHLLIHPFTKHVLNCHVNSAALGILQKGREWRRALPAPQERCSVLHSVRCDAREH